MRNRWLITMIGAAAGLYVVKKLGQGWGATDDEARGPLPGDDIVPDPQDQSTHAITIRAPAAEIWPWLVQMGYGRAGWYMDAWWDKMLNTYFWPAVVPEEVRAEYWPPAQEIIPGLQGLQVGDVVPDGPPDTAYFTVKALETGRLLGLYSDTHARYLAPHWLHGTRLATYGEFSWAFVLNEIDPAATRLILRMRANVGPPAVRLASLPLVMVADYVQVREILLGIKRRVERAGESGGELAG